MQDNQALMHVLKQKLSKKRYHHCICVQEQAIMLAERYGVDPEQAGTAGLLHDIMHCEPKMAQLKYIQGNAILLDDFTRLHPQLWHAIAGSIFLQKELGIADRAVIDAVRYHTTGRGSMNRLEQIVYLADVTSADRDFPDVEQTRLLTVRSLEEGMRYVLIHTIRQLLQEEKTIVRDTWEAYNQFARKEQEDFA